MQESDAIRGVIPCALATTLGTLSLEDVCNVIGGLNTPSFIEVHGDGLIGMQRIRTCCRQLYNGQTDSNGHDRTGRPAHQRRLGMQHEWGN